jgi:hypothetical protein
MLDLLFFVIPRCLRPAAVISSHPKQLLAVVGMGAVSLLSSVVQVNT